MDICTIFFDFLKMSQEYNTFQEFIYEDMMKEWKRCPLSYIISKHNIDLIMQRDSTITTEKIMNDFRKFSAVKEVFMSGDQIVILPK